MIALALCWLILFRASTAAGHLILRFVDAAPPDDDHWFIAFWVGLLSIAAVVFAVVPFAPASYASPVLVLALYRRAPAPPRFFWPIAAAMTYVASSPVRLYDTALYHQPAIEWMSARGLVPGLALVHFRFGFTSSWLALTSLFNVGPLHARASVVITGLVVAVMLAHWIGLHHRNNSRESRFYVAGLPLLLLFFFLDSAIVSPSPNLAAGLAVFTGIWMLLRSPGNAANLLIAAGAVAIKLSAAPLFLVALVRAPRTARVLAVAGAFAAPLLVANFQTTGCPLFPAILACIDAPSSLPATHVSDIAHETLNWARYAGPYPAAAPYLWVDWIPRNLSMLRNALVAAIALVSLAFLLIRRQFDAASAAAIFGSIYVYAAAPDPRFGAGFLFALPALALPALPLPVISRSALAAALAVSLTIGAIACEWISNHNLPDARYEVSPLRLLIPAPAWSPPRGVVAFDHNGTRFYRPVATDRCGTAPLPCTPYPILPTLRPCGRGWCR
ncbi:MAG: hypothetical protein ABI972_06230 [Acidobacteriota bacterium]